ncbi:hypothetical protein ASG30_20150 [Ramlibacter sp. Leaf400]|nr:hypothetical protein ASG30_20150 [Ramlibacter sp. Leaf400]
MIDYRDRLQEVLDSDWSELSPEQMYVRALEGYRWLNLLENAMAKGPQQFTLHLDNVTEVLEYAIHQAQPRRRAA